MGAHQEKQVSRFSGDRRHRPWIPAFAGMTGMGYATFVDFDDSSGFRNCPV